MNTLVVGFPYVRENFFAVFRHWPHADNIRFLLPVRWPIKGGASEYAPPSDNRITTARAFFADYRWKYPVIGGLLKGWMPAFAGFLWKNRHRSDIVYICSEPILLATLYYALLTRLLNKKAVLFSWENISYEKKFRGISRIVHGALLRINLWLAHGLMCGNNEGALIHRSYMSGKPIAVIPMNGVDEVQFSRKSNTGHRDSPLNGKVVFTFIGALGYRKGVHFIVQAFPEVLRAIPNAHLVIAGSGEYEGEIKRLTDEPFITGKITLFPWISHHEVVRLLNASDVFVYPSFPHKGWTEQFGYSMAEASLMELPVVSTRTGSIAAAVVDGVTGLLIEPSDVAALTAAMIRLGRDEALRVRLGQAGRKHIMDKYSNRSVADQMYHFFRTL